MQMVKRKQCCKSCRRQPGSCVSPGLVVMGDSSRSRGCGFESRPSGYWRRFMFIRLWVRIPAPYTGWTRHFFTLISCKNCIVSLKRPKKRPWLAHLNKKLPTTGIEQNSTKPNLNFLLG